MNLITRGFLNTNAFVVVLVSIRTVLLELSALFPYKRITQIALRVTIQIIIANRTVTCGKQLVFPSGIVGVYCLDFKFIK